MFKTLTLVTILALGTIVANGPAAADYEFDSSGAPINMHLVPAPADVSNIYASADMPRGRAVSRFTAEEKALFDRTTKPYDSY